MVSTFLFQVQVIAIFVQRCSKNFRALKKHFVLKEINRRGHPMKLSGMHAPVGTSNVDTLSLEHSNGRVHRELPTSTLAQPLWTTNPINEWRMPSKGETCTHTWKSRPAPSVRPFWHPTHLHPSRCPLARARATSQKPLGYGCCSPPSGSYAAVPGPDLRKFLTCPCKAQVYEEGFLTDRVRWS